jgi:hypothetical protein
MQQGRVQLDADWNEQQAIHRHHMETESRDVIGRCGAPSDDAGFEIIVDEKDKTKLKIGTGRYYVDGILCENDRDEEDFIYYDEQSDLPNPPDLIELLSNKKAQYGLVYLDVWNHHITALDDPHIREKALGDPDSTTRIKTVWQVKILPLRNNEAPNCSSNFAEWKDLIRSRDVKLNALTQPLEAEAPCYLPPKSGYHGPENQLYRVEVHKSGVLDGGGSAPTFKWSRDNGFLVTEIENIDGTAITVSNCGKDNVLCFSEDQWVEIIDDIAELNEMPGELVQIIKVDYNSRIIGVEPKPKSNFGDMLHPKLRRWDHNGDSADGLKIKGRYQDLEKGIQIQFSEGSYKTGDYWLIPARTATGDIEWPPYQVPNKNPIAQQRLGVYHHYCCLALIRMIKEGEKYSLTLVKDCRKKFLPLTEINGKDEEEEAAIHVKEVLIGEALLINDSNVKLDYLKCPIKIICDSDIDGTNINRYNNEENRLKRPNPICSVTVDIPSPPKSPISFQPSILNGNVEVDGKVITWRANADNILPWLNQILEESRFLLAHLSLKGNFIWAQKDPNSYLDGEAFGFGGNGNIDLRLPASGDGKRGGNFELWFWIS